ncbi:hypothetical protein KR215_010119 [Drosophila sulfurigaster]|nr:hypothetical protein KR215_010119 [Drosophila sulfurigaster]
MESCRICMGNTDVEVDLFTNQPLYHMEMTLLDMINEIVDLNIQFDKLPRKICTTCVSDAQVAFRFKRNCERSNNVFKALISDEGSNDGGEANSDAPHNQTDYLDDKEWNPSSYDTDIIVKTEPSLELYVVNEMVNDAPDWENDFVEDNQRDISLQDRNVIVKMEEDAVIDISEDEDECNLNLPNVELFGKWLEGIGKSERKDALFQFIKAAIPEEEQNDIVKNTTNKVFSRINSMWTSCHRNSKYVQQKYGAWMNRQTIIKIKRQKKKTFPSEVFNLLECSLNSKEDMENEGSFLNTDLLRDSINLKSEEVL